jgi:hypothetical protein
LPPSDRERWRQAAAAAQSSGLVEGARFGPNSAPRITQGLSVLAEPTLQVQTTSGFDVELLLAAGLDLGRTAYAGYPISWGTPLDAAWPPVRPASPDWLGRWQGGLLTTCGMRNVGAASGGWGLHGDHIFRQASGVEARHLEIDGRPAVRVRGTVWDGPALGTVLQLERTVVIFDEEPEIRVADVLRNRSARPECALMLYHLNLGAPFVTPLTQVVGVDSLSVRDTDSDWLADWPNVGRPQPGETELVAEATLSEAGVVNVVNEAAGARLEISWSADALPRTHVWRRRRADAYVLAIEPANCSLLGREHELSNPATHLAGHGERRTCLTLALSGLADMDGDIHDSTV